MCIGLLLLAFGTGVESDTRETAGRDEPLRISVSGMWQGVRDSAGANARWADAACFGLLPCRSHSAHSVEQGLVEVDATVADNNPQHAEPVFVGPAVAAVAGHEALICSYPWPCAEALGVVYGNARCPNGESTGNAAAISPDGDNFGLFQINRVHRGRVESLNDLLDPAVNVAIAWELYRERGWQPWACRP